MSGVGWVTGGVIAQRAGGTNKGRVGMEKEKVFKDYFVVFM